MKLPILLSLVLLLAFLPACGGEAAEPEPEPEPTSTSFSSDLLQPVTAEDLMDEVQAAGADVVVVNFWATWCAPCREEFPAFVQLIEESDPQEVAVRFVTVDFEEQLPEAEAFLQEYGVTGPGYMMTGNENAFINAINPEWSGSIPATVLYARDGTRLDFWMGKTDYEQLTHRVEAARRAS